MKRRITFVSALVAMMVAVGCQAPQNNNTVAVQASASSEMPIAYINTDSLLLNYEYAKKISEELLSQEESSRAELNQKGRVFQQEVADFQRKVQNTGFLSMDRAQKEQDRLAKQEQQLLERQQQLNEELLRLFYV